MKQSFELMKQFINKEKILIIFSIFILLNICLNYTYNQSVYSQGYMQQYPDAPLEFFYYIQMSGVNPFVVMILTLLLPNLISYDLLEMQQNHTTYFIETRIGKKRYYRDTFIKNYLFTFITILILEVSLILVIHFFYGKILFQNTIYPEGYHALTQTICKNEILNLIIFILLTSLGYALLSSIIFSIQVFIPYKYIYRCSGFVLGIALIVVPILIMGYFPIKDIAVLFQINPLIALGIEQVRENPFGLSNILHYIATFTIYAIISNILYQILYKWRKRYD